MRMLLNKFGQYITLRCFLLDSRPKIQGDALLLELHTIDHANEFQIKLWEEITKFKCLRLLVLGRNIPTFTRVDISFLMLAWCYTATRAGVPMRLGQCSTISR